MSLHNWSNKKIIVENTSSYMDNLDFDIVQEVKNKKITDPSIAEPSSNTEIIAESTSTYMDDTNFGHADRQHHIVEEARGKKIVDPLRAKLMGMEDIRDLKGTMTPRYFATKVIRYLQKENPELDLENLSDDDIQNAINIMANVSKPLASRPDVKITTRERGAAKAGLKKGDTGFETLQLNLGSDTTLNSEGGVGENDLYTVVSDGLKYRVTLNSFKGQKINLDDISQDDVVSVVIVKPSETEQVDKFGGEIEMGQREKLVADFPEGEEGKFDRYGRNIQAKSEDEIDLKKADLDNDGKLSDYEKARAEAAFGGDDEENEEKDEMKKERERAGQDHARAVADHYDDDIEPKDEDANDQYAPADAAPDDTMGEMEPLDDEEEERCPVTGKLRKKKSESEEEEQVAMSQQEVNRQLVTQHRQKMQNAHSQERMNRWGY